MGKLFSCQGVSQTGQNQGQELNIQPGILFPKVSLGERESGKSIEVAVDGVVLTLSNLDKMYFPESGITKGELLQYYTDMAPLILPHIKQSPFVMVRYPDGISGEYFYQKECPPQAPDWVRRFTDPQSGKGLTYIICDRLATLIYLVNLGCIEVHAWASTALHPDYPEWAVFDLDPAPPSGIREAYQVARWLTEILTELNINFLVKTSGATGLHILVPIEPKHTFAEVQNGVKGICQFLQGQRPDVCTLERAVKNRNGKVYLDYLQNGRGRTMAGIYSVRPTALGNISIPLLWQEVAQGVDPQSFHLGTIGERIKKLGDLSKMMEQKNDFAKVLHYFT